ncbi:MAG TPA: alkaline phosphatase family protein [Myxococcota bacterium]|nr:alkaline phosphatase family protein [Myxococcota bacterium]
MGTLLYALIGCSSSPDRRLVVFGIDGLEWSMVEGLELPNFQRLREEGVSGTVETTVPVMSPIIWTSIASGYEGEVHGIGGWTDGRTHAYDASDVRVMRIWDVATLHDKKSLVVGWLMSFPASPIEGAMLSERFVWSFPMNKDPGDPLLGFSKDRHEDLVGLATPPALEARAAELLPTDDWLEAHELAYQVAEYGAPFHPLLRDELHMRVFEDQWPESDADLGMLYVNGIDQVSHLYWPYSDPEIQKMLELEPQLHAEQALAEMAGSPRRAVPFSEAPITGADIELGSRFVPDYYRAVDDMLGRVLDVVDLETTTLLVCSDHGFKPAARYPLIGGGHSREAAVLLVGAGVQPGELPGGSVLDIAPTIYAVLDLPAAEDWPGEPLLFSTDVEPVTTWVLEDRAQRAIEASTAANPQLMHQLEALGYVDGEGKPILGASRKGP